MIFPTLKINPIEKGYEIKMICIDFSTWDWGTIASLIGATASVISVILVIYIFGKWKGQKQQEVVAIEAGTLIEKIETLQEQVMRATTESGINPNFVYDVMLQMDRIEDSLILISVVAKDLKYEAYIHSILQLSKKWSLNQENQDEYSNFLEESKILCKSLKPLKLFMDINQPIERSRIKYRNIF